jgi:uncharacterized protein YeaO (DUF488 family)
MIKTKSVRTKIDRRNDGLRILVTRGRGRGLPADRYDVWMANLGPSEQLLGSYLSGKITWKQYARRYLQELRGSDLLDSRNRNIRNHGQKFTLRLLQHLGKQQNVTLLCHCSEEERHCHRHVLQDLLSRLIK